MTTAAPFPNADNELSRWGIERKSTPEQARQAFANLTKQDFIPFQGSWGKPEQEAAIELLSGLCMMDRSTSAPATVESLKKSSRFLLNNVTLLEAQHAAAKLDGKTTDWYHKHGKPRGAAQCLIDEVSRMKSEQAKDDGNKYLQEPTIKDEGSKYTKWLDL